MSKTRTLFAIPLMLLTISALPCAAVTAQEISARISTREAYVGQPIVLQIQIANAENYSLPEDFAIDGCKVRAAGTPAQSSQITIINGRRSESRSVTMQYLITPRHAGRFEIPELKIDVDGKTRKTTAISFVATKSETGDLLFAEVDGKAENVFVGQSLDLKLKIWLKPFRDRKNRIELDEGQMWQMLSEQTSWGSFAERIQELAENRQRPSGKKVLRRDGKGNEREYFLYEIDATVYPTKPGKIDARDVQIVVNYPMELGRSRDPFDRFFEDSPFGGSSLLKGMMDDDFFRDSPFGRRLSVEKSRPIVAEIAVDATIVLPVPTAGRPVDYRGAVGRYRIITEAEPKTVDAGDPITLRIGIVGDGPMELVQAPPLHLIESLRSGFKVTDQSLAGFVQDDTKVFVTTIRAKNSKVKQIPPIPFSFFDPASKSYETVYSESIDLTVEKAETLALDSIVISSRSGKNQLSQEDDSESVAIGMPDLLNDFSDRVLQSENRPGASWLYFAVVPPLCWVVVLSIKLLAAAFATMPSIRTARSTALASLDRSQSSADIALTLIGFVARKTKSEFESREKAIGKLRTLRLNELANRLESFLLELEKIKSGILSETKSPDHAKQVAKSLVIDLDAAITQTIRKNSRTNRRRTNSLKKRVTAAVSAIGLSLLSSQFAGANDLNQQQQEAILSAANEAYRVGLQTSDSDQPSAVESFGKAASKYQLLVNSGVRNSRLFLNLGNAFWLSGDRGRAIANYHRALQYDPSLAQARKNLKLIKQELQADNETSANEAALGKDSWSRYLTDWSAMVTRIFGSRNAILLFSIASILFWLLLILKTIRTSLPLLRWAWIPALIALIFAIGLYFQKDSRDLAIITVNNLELRNGDGEEFATIANVDPAVGLKVEIIGQRNNWLKVALEVSQVEGWLKKNQVERVQL